MAEKPENLEHEINVVWRRPDIRREIGEIGRVIEVFVGLEPTV